LHATTAAISLSTPPFSSRWHKGVLDYFGVTADEAPTIYLVVLKDQMLKYGRL
jgi:hypothetical protein